MNDDAHIRREGVTITTILADEFRFLTFRKLRPAINTHWKAYLTVGLIFTWSAGVCRYSNNPRADLWQHLGLGSLVYVFFLALAIWLLLIPMKPKNWSYRTVLIFVTLTAPLGLIFAIPSWKSLPSGWARLTDAMIPFVVAAWRVGLYVTFIRRVAAIPSATILVATLLLVAIIVIALSALNLEHAIPLFMIEAPEDHWDRSNVAFTGVVLLSVLLLYLSPFLLIGYAILAYQISRTRNSV